MRRLVVILLLLAAAAPALAQKKQDATLAEASRRMARGNKAYQEGKYDEALRLYLAAYELVPSPDILFNVGLAYEKLLDWEQCALTFARYLEQTKAGEGGDLRERADERRLKCREKARIPVKVSSNPLGAAISLGEGKDATFRGRTPAELALEPGVYAINVELPGYVPLRQQVTVEPGLRPEIDFPLEKLASLAIEVDVPGARVALGDAPPEPAPLRRELVAGAYAVRVTKPGYREVTREVRLEPGQQATLLVTLPPEAAQRALIVGATAPGVRLSLDDGDAAPAPLEVRTTTGRHRLVATAPGRVPFAGDIVIPEDRDLKLELRLAPPRGRAGRIAEWTLWGAGAASLAGAGVFAAMTAADRSEFDDTPSLAIAERGERHARTADGLLISAAVCVGAALVVRWLTSPEPSRVREVR